MTVRLRLTVVYGLLFVVAGAALLTINYVLLYNNLPAAAVSTVSAEDVIARAQKLLANPKLGPVERAALESVVAGGVEGVKALAKTPQKLPASLGKQLFADLPSTIRSDALHKLLVTSMAALAIVAVVSVGLGWFVAGRVLRPLRAITAAAQDASAATLGRRIDLHRPNDELKRLADTFDAMLGRLDAAFTGQRRFVANASHELRTPLTIMRTELDVVMGRPDATSAQLRAMGEVIGKTVDRCDRLVTSLLALASAEHGIDQAEVVDLAEVGRQVLTERKGDLDQRSLTVTTDLVPAAVHGEAGLLDRVLENLVDNAIVHNYEGGWVRVTTAASDDVGEVVVASSGREIPPDRVAELFEPFRRLDERTGSQRGVGIGLSIVKAVALAHAGGVTAEPVPGGGLHIRVEIPLAGSPRRTDQP